MKHNREKSSLCHNELSLRVITLSLLSPCMGAMGAAQNACAVLAISADKFNG
jgi:hypothetical protein